MTYKAWGSLPAGPEKWQQFEAHTADGAAVNLGEYAMGKVALVVNVASRCGFTKQYAGLQALYDTYRDQGFVILAFPCNQFGGQEPGTNAQIAEFCRTEFGVTFPIFEKILVNGSDAHPLFLWLRSAKTGWAGTSRIGWNFTKFLVSRQGDVVGRWSSRTAPENLVSEIERQLSQEPTAPPTL